MLLDDFFTETFRPERLNDRSPRTITLYEYSLRKFAKSLNRPPMVEDLNSKTVWFHLSALLESGLSMSTIEIERSRLCTIWKHARKRGVTNLPPSVEQLDVIATGSEPFTETELERIKRSCREFEGNVGGFFAGYWWHAMFLVVMDTGEHLGAILQAQWRDLKRGRLFIPVQNRKTNESERFELDAKTLRAVERLRREPGDVIFPWPSTRDYIYHRFNRICVLAGIDTSEGDLFGRLRASAGVMR